MAAVEASGKSIRLQGVYPWGRYWAKIVDYYFISIFVAVGFEMLKAASPEFSLPAFVLVGFCPAVEAAMITWWGTTPGKALFRISLSGAEGAKLKFGTSFSRSYSCFFRGLALGIPLISLYTMYKAYEHYSQTGKTTWDADLGVVAYSLRPTWVSWVGLAASLAVMVAFSAFGAAEPS